jgi:tRNA(fMet)-specific endonuclease VapC
MTLYLLDTNIASHIIKGDHPTVLRHLVDVPMSDIVVSAVTEAELCYGVAKRGNPDGLTRRVREFLIRVAVLPWTREAAHAYGQLRTDCEAAGVTLAPMDMMIAAHAQAAGAILVTHDRAFSRVPAGLNLADWTVR